MAEIARPVRVEGYLENEGNAADLFCVRDADGGYVAMVLPKEAADQITAAINEHAALRALP